VVHGANARAKSEHKAGVRACNAGGGGYSARKEERTQCSVVAHKTEQDGIVEKRRKEGLKKRDRELSGKKFPFAQGENGKINGGKRKRTLHSTCMREKEKGKMVDR